MTWHQKFFFSSLLLLFSTNQTKEDCHTGQKGIRIGFYFEKNLPSYPVLYY